jgi:hypothetical protein
MCEHGVPQQVPYSCFIVVIYNAVQNCRVSRQKTDDFAIKILAQMKASAARKTQQKADASAQPEIPVRAQKPTQPLPDLLVYLRVIHLGSTVLSWLNAKSADTHLPLTDNTTIHIGPPNIIVSALFATQGVYFEVLKVA